MNTSSPMIVNFHSHWGTRRGYPYRTEAELAHQRRVWKQEASYVTEEEMATYFRKNGVQTMLDLGFTKYLPIEEAREFHHYAIETQKRFPDAILGNWLQLDPRTGAAGIAELERWIGARGDGFIGLCVPRASIKSVMGKAITGKTFGGSASNATWHAANGAMSGS